MNPHATLQDLGEYIDLTFHADGISMVRSAITGEDSLVVGDSPGLGLVFAKRHGRFLYFSRTTFWWEPLCDEASLFAAMTMWGFTPKRGIVPPLDFLGPANAP